MHPNPCRARQLLAPTVLFIAALALTGCSESLSFLKPGPLFETAEEVPPLQGQVYFYWPSGEPGQWNELLVGICEKSFAFIQPGGYTGILVPPGSQCFQAEGVWEMGSIRSTASLKLDSLDLDVAAGETLFVRVENGHGLLPSGMSLRAVEPAKAEPEIKKCGQMIAMTEDEMRQAWRARESG